MVRYLSVYLHFSGLQIIPPPPADNIHPAAFQRRIGVTALCLLSAAFVPGSFHFQGESESVSQRAYTRIIGHSSEFKLKKKNVVIYSLRR